jgi:hypothetical protein
MDATGNGVLYLQEVSNAFLLLTLIRGGCSLDFNLDGNIM